MELYLDAAVLVRVNLLAGGPDHGGDLAAPDKEFGRLIRGAEHQAKGDRVENIAVVILADVLLDFAELERNDLLERLVAHRIIGNDY